MLDVELTAMFTKQFYVYILTNKAQTVLYTGITNDLKKRVWSITAAWDQNSPADMEYRG